MKLGDIINLHYGKSLPKRKRNDGPIPVYGSGGVTGNHNKHLIEGPGIIVGRKGSIGTVYFEDENFFPIDTVFYVEHDEEEVDQKYLYFYLKEMNLENMNTDAAVPGLNRDVALSQKISIPDLSIQQGIASILSAFDDLIENNTRRIEILEEMARRIYREWFVHFHYPGHENDELVDSGAELGEIPAGWEVKKLEDVIGLTYGKGLRKKDRVEGQYPVYGSSGIIDWHNDFHVEGPGVIVGRKGNVGSMFWEYKNFNPIDTTFYVETKLPLTYAFYNLKNQNFINSDAAVPGLSKRQASTLPVLIPDEENLKNFDTKILQLFDLKRVLNEKNEKLKETRDLLLAKLISGEVEVDEFE